MNPGYIPFFAHDPTRDLERMRRAQPSALKLYLHRTGNDLWRSIRDACPNTYFFAIDTPRSDLTDLTNPRGDAEASAREFDARPAAVRRVGGPNERLKQGHSIEEVKRWVAYHVDWVRWCHHLGLNVAVGAVNTGHPGLTLFGDARDQWPEVAAVDHELAADDCWDLHEYWDASGPLMCWPWTTGRHLRCPTTHRIVIGEYGFDQAVNAPEGTPNHGWQGLIHQGAYVQQIIAYHQMLTDRRLVGTCGFLLDYEDRKWATFDVLPLVDDLIARQAECGSVSSWATMPTKLQWPVARYVRLSQTFEEHRHSNPKGGWGLDISCVTGTPVQAMAAGVVDRVEDDPPGYGRWVQVNHRWGFTRYGHLSWQGVRKGDYVDAGAVLGQSGSTGNSTGPHLHVEVLPMDNRSWPYRVDPAPLLGIGGGSVPEVRPEEVSGSDLDWAQQQATGGAVPFFARAATREGLVFYGIEGVSGGYTRALCGRSGTEETWCLKCPTGQWEYGKVTKGKR
jgi:hypothetical protein